MDTKFDVEKIRKLKFCSMAGRHHQIEMDADEGWLYISTDVTDDRNRIVDYSCTFPLEEWMLKTIEKITVDGDVPHWKTGECTQTSKTYSDLQWDLRISTSGEEFEYSGYDAFPDGFDAFIRGTVCLAITLIDSFSIDIDRLKEVYLSTDNKLNNDSFSLNEDSLFITIDGERHSLDTVPDHLNAVKSIVKDYTLRPFEPKERRPMESGKNVHMAITDEYDNRLCLWWGEERPVWVDDLAKRLYDVAIDAYNDCRTVAKEFDPFLPRNPKDYRISNETRNVILKTLNMLGFELPMNDGSLVKVWSHIREQKNAITRRLCIGKTADTDELKRITLALKELEQFRLGTLDYNRINSILDQRMQ